MATNKYTLSGNPEIEALLDGVLETMRGEIAALPESSRIRAAVLGGGYGRGEGGVRAAPDGFRLYNDMDFFFFVSGLSGAKRQVLADALKRWSEKYAARLGIDVDFAFQELSKLPRVADTLMFMELKAGHRLVYGDDRFFDRLATPDFTRLSAAEGARLLLNRGAGLLLAGRVLDGTEPKTEPERSDFVSRNIHKSELCCGDAWLIFRRSYAPGLDGRLARLRALGAPADVVAAYAEAVEFKRAVRFFAPEEQPLRLAEARRRWLRVLGDAVTGGGAPPPEKVPELTLHAPWREGRPGRNLLLNCIARRYGMPFGAPFQHPRKRILASLAGILLEKSVDTGYIMESTKNKPDAAVTESRWLRIWRRFS